MRSRAARDQRRSAIDRVVLDPPRRVEAGRAGGEQLSGEAVDRCLQGRRVGGHVAAISGRPERGWNEDRLPVFLPRAVGEKIAAEMFMTGDSINAARAFEIGMINSIAPAGELMSEAGTAAAKLAAAPTAAIGRIKRMLNASSSNDLNAQLALEHECQVESGRSSDFKEGVAAFFEKRAPVFTGK